MTVYAGAQEVERNSAGTQVTVKTYWPGGIGVEIDRPNAATELNWTHADHLGSVAAITDAAGNIKEKLEYDAWGKRRTPDGSATPDTLDGVTDNKGYTGHEMLDQLDLVHMNGRVYDPFTARFMSGDPFIQAPGNGQSYNRYSYVWNNPVNGTDPSGYLSIGGHKILPGLFNDDNLRIGAALAIAFVTQQWYVAAQYTAASAAATAAGAWGGEAALYGAAAATSTSTLATAGALGGFAGSFVASGGNLESGLRGAVGGAIGGAFTGSNGFGQVVGSGVNGYIQTGTSQGFVRGLAAGAIPQDLGFSDTYRNNGLANIGISLARDGLRGGVIGGKRGIIPGIVIGQSNNFIGHILGLGTTRSLPKFEQGAFIYEGNFWQGKGELTIGNVISGEPGLSSDPQLANVYAHERDHIFNPFEQALGAFYLPAHILDLGIGNLGRLTNSGCGLYVIEEHVQHFPYSTLSQPCVGWR